jgi:hypothetical protein
VTRLLGIALACAALLLLANAGAARAAASLQNAGLEATRNGDSVPDCWSQAGYGSNIFTFGRTTDAHSGAWAERLHISQLTNGQRRLVSARDEGACAPEVTAGETDSLSAWYKSDAPTQFVVFVRDGTGSWSYWTSGPKLPKSETWSQATFTPPATPAGSTAISFGLTLGEVGTLTTDDYGLFTTSGPPVGPCAKQTEWSAPQIRQAANEYLYTPMSDPAAASCAGDAAEAVPANAQANAYVPSDGELAAFRNNLDDAGQTPEQVYWYTRYVTGRPGLDTPTTDELIQWAAHKWGIPEDYLRAQYTQESSWDQAAMGDLTTSPTPAIWAEYDNANPAYTPNGIQAYESVGITQDKWRPNNYPNGTQGAGTEPLRWLSTAFNIDYQCSILRFYYDNPYGKRSAWGDGAYHPLDDWLSIGAWFQPYPYGNAGQDDYVNQVQQHLAARDWPH